MLGSPLLTPDAASPCAHRINLLAGSVQTADMLCDNPGNWFFHCHINDHIAAGMKTIYTVSHIAPTPPEKGIAGASNVPWIRLLCAQGSIMSEVILNSSTFAAKEV